MLEPVPRLEAVKGIQKPPADRMGTVAARISSGRCWRSLHAANHCALGVTITQLTAEVKRQGRPEDRCAALCRSAPRIASVERMRSDFLVLLRCPSCSSPDSLQLDAIADDGRETREGRLRCRSCQLERPVRDGVADLMHDPSPKVRAEAEGLERFALEMRHDGWDRARILNLPYEENGYWWTQRRSMELLLETAPFTPGQSILDIGSNTCWATATFARIGLRAVALDISMVEMQGLRTADWWFEEQGTYFERVLAQMSALPFADDSFDWVFCCEVLHHNDRRGMTDALREIHRVLRPGGSLLVMNEPLRWPTDLKRDHGVEVVRFAGNEHVYFCAEYIWMAWRAGFHQIRVTEPAFDGFFSHDPIHLTLQASVLGSVKLAAINVARQRAFVRRLHMWWHYLMGPEVSLQMICTKSGARAEPRHRHADRLRLPRVRRYADGERVLMRQ
jgi:SAM-dependent methyltransferase